MEKTELICNGPCGHMTLACPSGHRVAIRDAVYRVQERSDSCTPFTGCAGDVTEDVCCEPTPDDCVFSFSPSHLRAAQRNCSHAPGCQLQTERSEIESVQCSASDPASQTLVNYVCVNDSMVTDVCSRQERVVQGKTLFALLNPRGPTRPHQGSVCTCLAESTKWPTTNSIAAFIVDMRLNRVDSEQCANASMTVRSGSNQKTLTCATSRDPRVNFPFVAVLNDSNVASLRLQLDKHLPEFIWLGFEGETSQSLSGWVLRLTRKKTSVCPASCRVFNPHARTMGGAHRIGMAGEGKSLPQLTVPLKKRKRKRARSQLRQACTTKVSASSLPSCCLDTENLLGFYLQILSIVIALSLFHMAWTLHGRFQLNSRLKTLRKVMFLYVTNILSHGNANTDLSSSIADRRLPLAVILGAVFAGVAVVIIFIIIIIVVKRKWKSDHGGLPEAGESESELDLYYSTTADDRRRRQLLKHGKRPSNSSTDSRKELYISAEQVRANKRANSSKRVRIVSTPDIVEDLGPELYASRKQIRENKRQSQKKKQAALEEAEAIDKLKEHPPPLSPKHVDDEEEDDHYDRLHRPQKNMAAILESYDQLEPSENSGHQPAYSSAEVRVQRSDSTRRLVAASDLNSQQRHGNENQAYEITDVKDAKGESKSLFRITPSASNDAVDDTEVYFELEADVSSRNSTASVSSNFDPSQQPGSAPSSPRLSDSRTSDEVTTSTPVEAFDKVTMRADATLPIRGVSLDDLCKTISDDRDRGKEKQDDEEEIYNDGRSEFPPSQRRLSSPEIAPVPSPSSKPKKRTRASVAGSEPKPPSTPVAAPRRKPSLGPASSSANYDLAKPISNS
ncbi:hypothetical protein ElyMa_005553500 [Elysia marginata]|uniref:Uncharacterized protein n=1 Tax=Elysia marginata TaxID=1093978 RepID=A0AAV4EZ52_9GAST|nr:hypothetical protein ElyMa_005553500 [Elysia marginata]